MEGRKQEEANRLGAGNGGKPYQKSGDFWRRAGEIGPGTPAGSYMVSKSVSLIVARIVMNDKLQRGL